MRFRSALKGRNIIMGDHLSPASVEYKTALQKISGIGGILLPTLAASAFLLSGFDSAIGSILSTDAEMGMGLQSWFMLTAGHAVLVSGILLPILLILAIGEAIARLTGSKKLSHISILLLSAVGGFFLFLWGAVDATNGDWISQQWYAAILHYGLAATGAAIAFCIALYLRRNWAMSQRWRWLNLFTALMFAAGLSIANATLFPNSYFRIHVLMHILSAFFVVATCYLLANTVLFRQIPARAGRFSLAFPLAVIGISIFSLVIWIDMSRATRAELILKSMTARNTIRTAERIIGGEISIVDLLVETLKSQKVSSASSTEALAVQSGQIVIPDDWNILFIVNDTARADIYEPNRKSGQVHAKKTDTPFLNRWLKGTTRFRNCYAQGACTIQSMPYLFKSLESVADPLAAGFSLGRVLEDAQKKSFAVIPSSFQEAKSTLPIYWSMFEQFERVTFYPNHKQQNMIDDVISGIRKANGNPFFGWLQTYALHPPYYADNHKLNARQCREIKKCYSRALNWIDGSLEKLVQRLDAMGLMEKTVIILGSDHGTNLGDNQDTSHAMTVWEETIHVPLSIYIPGVKGRIVDEVVGNIDILPTIIDLLGMPQHSLHKGQSLVPLIVRGSFPWKRSYFSRSNSANLVTVIDNKQKLIHDRDGNVFYRYNLQNDPKELQNLFDIQNPVDQELLIQLLDFYPDRFVSSMKSPKLRSTIREKLKKLHPKANPKTQKLLLTLAAADPSGELNVTAKELFKKYFDKNQHTLFQLFIAEEMFYAEPKYWNRRIKAVLKKIQGKQLEIDAIRHMVSWDMPKFSQPTVSRRMYYWVKRGDLKDIQPWLNLIYPWNKKLGRLFAPGFIELLSRACLTSAECTNKKAIEIDTFTLQQALEIISELQFERETNKRRLEELVMPFMHSNKIALRTAATRCLGKVGHNGVAVNELKRIIRNHRQPLALRKAAVLSLYKIQKGDALDFLLKEATDSGIAIELIGMARSEKYTAALPYLKKVATTHTRGNARKKARAAIAAIEEQPTEKL